MLSKIHESNLTVRQIKNGQTLFEKEIMQLRYNNPFLEVQELKEGLKNYINQTTPNKSMLMSPQVSNSNIISQEEFIQHNISFAPPMI